MIIALNYIIRVVVIKIIDLIRCSTESTQMIYITNMVFVCQFFNTGILPMLCSANLEGQLPPKIVDMFNLKGDSTDFNEEWFINIGDTIVGSLVFNILFPIIMEFGWFSMRLTFRILDKIGTDETNPSKCVTVQQYVNKYSGPTYFMHFKYSSIMNIIFLTMCFGTGMPILFPIAFASLVVHYTLENYMLYYVFKKPPAYDEVLNNYVLKKLAWAPFFLFAFGYWTLTNPQLLQTYEQLQPLERASSTFQGGHYWYVALNPYYMIEEAPAGILGIMAIFYFIYLIFRGAVWACVKRNQHIRCCKVPKIYIEEPVVDEDIGPYFDVLDKDDRIYSYAEEVNQRLWNIKTMLDDDFKKLKKAEGKQERKLTGIHCYDILRNPAYAQDFQYFSSHLPGRDDCIIDADGFGDNNSS